MRIFFFMLLCLGFLSGCSGHLENLLNENIAEERQFVLYGEDEVVQSTLMCGRREKEYKLNGYATELIEFGVLTIIYTDMDSLKFENAEYKLYIGMEKYEGMLEKNPFDNTLVADIKKIIDKNSNVLLEVYLDNEKFSSMKLNIIDEEWKINYTDCIEVLIDNYTKELKSMISNKTFLGEVYIKIINDYDEYMSDFYYYISVLGRSGQKISVLINPKNGEILASNSNITV